MVNMISLPACYDGSFVSSKHLRLSPEIEVKWCKKHGLPSDYSPLQSCVNI